MQKLIIFVLVAVVAIGGLGYWRGWFIVTKEGRVDVEIDATKFKQDRQTFGKTVGDKSRLMKEKIAGLWKKTEALAGDSKDQMQKELDELKKKHDRLEQQIKELEDTSTEKFESIKQDLSKVLDEVGKKIEELEMKLEESVKRP